MIAYNGYVVINKPKGVSSNFVVCKVRRVFSKALGHKVKAGHLGTLDPLAEGVVVVCIGKATRTFDYLLNKKKEYVATLKLGETTTTLDAEGEIIARSGLPKFKDLKKVINSFVGQYVQTPPSFSAVSINGVKAYDLARKGKLTDEQMLDRGKTVEIHSIQLLNEFNDDELVEEIQFKTICGGGTYIRSLCRDIALACDCVGYMAGLLRNSVGYFNISDSTLLDNIEVVEDMKFIEIEDIINMYFDRFNVSGDDAVKLKNGVPINCDLEEGKLVAVYFDNKLFGIGKQENKLLKIVTNLWQE